MDTFTHVFLGSVLVWIIFGVFGVQEEFLSSLTRKASFVIIMLGATIMDFDVLIPFAHRLYTHSLVFPLVFLLVGVALWATKQSRILYLISGAVGFQWLLHIVLDVGSFPPMGLFWPLSPLVYAFGVTFVDTGGGLPQLLLWMYVFTPFDWLTWGESIFGNTQWTIQLGVPFLAFLLFLLTVGRDFWPWWQGGTHVESGSPQ